MRKSSELLRRLVWLAGLSWLAGCALLTVPEEPQRPTPAAPVWSEPALREHLRVFNSSTMAGRATGTQGYARAASYVAARMDEYRLQPAIDGDFRIVYGSPFNYPRTATFWTAGVDSIVFIPGVDYLPDGRSDSGRVRLSSLVVAPEPGALAASGPEVGVLLPRDEASDARLQGLAAAAVPAVVIVGDLEPRVHPDPVPGLRIVQMTPPAVAALLDVPPSLVPSLLARRGDEVSLPRPAVLNVATDRLRLGGALNVVGYVAGMHPELAREAVLVCADLDAVGQFAGVRTFDFAHFGRGAAALLAMAHHYGYVSRRWNVPDRSLVFAVWSGARLGHRGLRAYLRNPTWALGRTRTVVYLGLPPDEVADVRAVLADHGLVLHAVPLPSDPLYSRATVLQPDPLPRRLARARPALEVPQTDLDMSAVLDQAVLDARAILQAAYPVVLRETTSLRPIPDLSDSLVVPPPALE